MEPPEDHSIFLKWLEDEQFDLGATEQTRLVSQLLAADEFVRSLHGRFVPMFVTYSEFWTRYFFKAHLLQRSIELRAEMIKRVSLASLASSSDDDDDDDDKEKEKDFNHVEEDNIVVINETINSGPELLARVDPLPPQEATEEQHVPVPEQVGESSLPSVTPPSSSAGIGQGQERRKKEKEDDDEQKDEDEDEDEDQWLQWE